jgi:adenine phosphoribosyltransferase
MTPRKTVKDYIRTIVDFPHEGILFRDVTTLFADPRGFRMCVDQLLAPYAGMRIDKVAGLEARGFILGGAVAHQLSTGFVPIRKKGKLPGQTIAQAYKLEYGEAVVEVHDDAMQPGEKVLLVDDLLATGGTAEAGIRLIERLGAEVVGCAFVVDLPDLGGRNRLEALRASTQSVFHTPPKAPRRRYPAAGMFVRDPLAFPRTHRPRPTAISVMRKSGLRFSAPITRPPRTEIGMMFPANIIPI